MNADGTRARSLLDGVNLGQMRVDLIYAIEVLRNSAQDERKCGNPDIAAPLERVSAFLDAIRKVMWKTI